MKGGKTDNWLADKSSSRSVVFRVKTVKLIGLQNNKLAQQWKSDSIVTEKL